MAERRAQLLRCSTDGVLECPGGVLELSDGVLVAIYRQPPNFPFLGCSPTCPCEINYMIYINKFRLFPQNMINIYLMWACTSSIGVQSVQEESNLSNSQCTLVTCVNSSWLVSQMYVAVSVQTSRCWCSSSSCTTPHSSCSRRRLVVWKMAAICTYTFC